MARIFNLTKFEMATIAACVSVASATPAYAQSQVTQATSGSASATNTLRMQAPAPQSAPKRADFKWKMLLAGESFVGDVEQTQVAGFILTGNLKYKLITNLDINATAKAILVSGYAQSRYGDNVAKNGLSFAEAVVSFRPFASFLTLQAGAINQSHLESPLLVSDRAFPGVMEKARIGNKEYEAEVRAQQTVPTSTTMSAETIENEPSPSFLTETLTLKARPLGGPVFLKAFGTHYAFRSLPMQVAKDSAPHGNTVNPVPNTENSRFNFQYEGWLAGGKLKWDFIRGYAWFIEGHVIQNTKAPDTYKNGQFATTGFDFSLPGDVTLTPKGTMFFAENDVAPAYYNESTFGHTNRQGWGADLDATFKTQNFKIGMSYVSSDIVNRNTSQAPLQYFMISFGTLYASL